MTWDDCEDYLSRLAIERVLPFRKFQLQHSESRTEVSMDSVTTYLDTLIRETHKPEAEVMTWAFQVGLRQLWRERALGQYLQNEISATGQSKPSGSIGSNWRSVSIRQCWKM